MNAQLGEPAGIIKPVEERGERLLESLHVAGEEGEHCTEDRTEDTISGQYRGRVYRVGVNKVVYNTKEDQNHAEPEWNCGDSANNPVD